MRIVIRADSSVVIGIGHIMRCLTLAGRFQLAGCDVSFICRDLPGNIIGLIEKKGFPVNHLSYNESYIVKYELTQTWLGENWEVDAALTIKVLQFSTDWLIIDHYSLDEKWENIVKPFVKNIMVIDDLADRHHVCNVLLDQNYYQDSLNRYDSLVPSDCLKLISPEFSLLREEFYKLRKKLRTRDGNIRKILIFFGGSDPSEATLKSLQVIKLLSRPDIIFDVVVGVSNPKRLLIEQICFSLPNTRYHCQVDNMAILMEDADLAIGAGGSVTWERCCLGLPALVYIIADNQREIITNCVKAGVIKYLGEAKALNIEDLIRNLKWAFDKTGEIEKMSERGKDLVDGLGLERVMSAMKIIQYRISIISDENSWINEYIPNLIDEFSKKGNKIRWIHQAKEINDGDFAFFLSCTKIVSSELLAKNRHNLVVHESALPLGRGWSPLTWQILEGKNEIPITLFEANQPVDSGMIYIRDVINFKGNELVSELRKKQAEATIKLCLDFVDDYPKIIKKGYEQQGEPTFYPRRTPKDSRIDPNKTIIEQFNLLRVVDNDKYPAYFELDGEIYFLKIEKQKSNKP